MDLFIEVIGWIGAGLTLLAYALVTRGTLPGISLLYQLLNIVGSVGLLASVLWHGALPNAILEILWMAIGLFGLIRIIRARRRARG